MKMGRKKKEEHEGYKPNTLLERNIARFSREQEDEWSWEERREKEKASEREVQVEEGDSSSTTLYHSSSPPPSPNPSTYFVRTASPRKMSPFHGSLSSCDSLSVRCTHTFRTDKKKKKKKKVGEIGEDPLTTRSVSQCNQAPGNLWWMIHQKEFTAFPFFFFLVCYSFPF